MNPSLNLRLFTVFLFLFSYARAFSVEENFFLIDGKSNKVVLALGTQIDERISPFSTFKVALSLMGFDSGILKDEKTPTWLFQQGYDDFLESWKNPQNPQSWMKTSCFWFSQLLAKSLGMDQFQAYLNAFNYGNCDGSGGLAHAWVNSSLKISPKEQVLFLQKMVQEKLPVSKFAMHMTKELLFLEMLENGWKLYGKTGWSGSNKPDGKNELGWFVGWIEKSERFFLFAYNVRAHITNPAERIPRVKKLLEHTNVMMRKDN